MQITFCISWQALRIRSRAMQRWRTATSMNIFREFTCRDTSILSVSHWIWWICTVYQLVAHQYTCTLDKFLCWFLSWKLWLGQAFTWVSTPTYEALPYTWFLSQSLGIHDLWFEPDFSATLIPPMLVMAQAWAESELLVQRSFLSYVMDRFQRNPSARIDPPADPSAALHRSSEYVEENLKPCHDIHIPHLDWSMEIIYREYRIAVDPDISIGNLLKCSPCKPHYRHWKEQGEENGWDKGDDTAQIEGLGGMGGVGNFSSVLDQ